MTKSECSIINNKNLTVYFDGISLKHFKNLY